MASQLQTATIRVLGLRMKLTGLVDSIIISISQKYDIQNKGLTFGDNLF